MPDDKLRRRTTTRARLAGSVALRWSAAGRLAVSAAAAHEELVDRGARHRRFEQIIKGSGEREISTTMSCAASTCCCVLTSRSRGTSPIVADEARTFGMEGMFRQIGIYAPFGQKCCRSTPTSWMYARDQKGQVLRRKASASLAR